MKTPSVHIFYSFVHHAVLNKAQLLMELPEDLREKVLSYKKESDQNLVLMGKIMLVRALKNSGYDPHLHLLNYNPFGKPTLPGGPHFNISHTGQLVVIAISETMEMGIDAEEVKPLQLEDFQSFLTNEEWTGIQNSNNPLMAFYHVWAKKEAVMKAVGKGLSLPLKEIRLQKELATTPEGTFYLKEIKIAEKYPCYLALTNSEVSLKLENFLL